MTSKEYWAQREEEAKAHYLSEEEEINIELMKKFNYLKSVIEKEINGFYQKYANAEGITMAEAKKAVDKMDVQAFQTKAAKYVEEKNFTKQANDELRLYNATMKINRLELLKANIGLEMIDTFNDLEKDYDTALTRRCIEEFERQAGILGSSVKNSAKATKSIVNASFNNAHFSTRLWRYQGQLKNELSSLLLDGLVQGINPKELARHIEKRFGAKKKDAQRLMQTEMARVQTAAQEEAFKENDIDRYIYLALGETACPICKRLNENIFNVSAMKVGENAPPMHPRCRCSTAAYVERTTNKISGANSYNGNFENVYYTDKATYNIDIDNLSKDTNMRISEAAKSVAQKGSADGAEHMYLVNLEDSNDKYYETNGMPNEVGYEFWKHIKNNKGKKYAFVHNHNTNTSFSETDIQTLLTTKEITTMIAVRNDGVIYVTQRTGDALQTGWFDDLYKKDIDKLNDQLKSGKITIAERSIRREVLIVNNLVRDYTGGLIVYDTRK